MKDIKPRYTFVKEYKKTFVNGYTHEKNKNGDFIKVKLEGRRPWLLEATDENVYKTENAMEQQRNYQVKEILPAIKKDAKLEILLAVSSIVLALGSKLFNFPEVDDKLCDAIHYVSGVFSTIGTSLCISSIAKAKDITKWDYYFNNQKTLNGDIEQSFNMLSGTSRKTKRAIKHSGEERLLNPTNLDKISHHDLQVIQNNIEAQKDLEYEFNNPIEKRLI